MGKLFACDSNNSKTFVPKLHMGTGNNLDKCNKIPIRSIAARIRVIQNSRQARFPTERIPMNNLNTNLPLVAAFSLVLGLMAITQAVAAPTHSAPALKPAKTTPAPTSGGSTQQKAPPSHNQGPLNLPGY